MAKADGGRGAGRLPEGVPVLALETALFLDIDGTLLDFAARPDAVEVPPRLRRNLAVLHGALGGALALVSGRSLAQIDELFAPLRLPAAGQHGAELRLAGETVALPPDPRLVPIAAAFAEFASAHPGILIENKGHSIALHYRGAPQDREAARTLAECLVAAAGPGLQLLPARLAIDIKARLVSKGSAIDWFMDRPPFRGRIPTFLGDDRTDEDGFVAVDARGGHSVHVGDGFDSVARFRLGSPRDVRRWLGQEARRRGPAAASIRQSR